MLTFKDFFKMGEKQEQKDKTNREKSIALHKELKDHFDLCDDDYSKEPNIWINLEFVNPYDRQIEDVGSFQIYGPYIFNYGILTLYKQKSGDIVEVWNDKIFKNGVFVGKYDYNSWPTTDDYKIAMYNNLDQY